MSPLFLLAPSLGLAYAAGYARELLPLLLAFYYLLPLPLYALGLGARAVSRLLLPEPGPLLLRLSAALLPYALYWAGAGFLRAPLLSAYQAFLQGPGLAVPLAVLVAWPLGLRLPPLLASLLFLGLFLLFERGARWARRGA